MFLYILPIDYWLTAAIRKYFLYGLHAPIVRSPLYPWS